ncbi:hypothetical protein C8R46DRAFT_1045280 [Mycena filopes]|nr:hypothetical protein C8R46DRAFT_1045280 [Mycena filopes]
MVSVSDPSLSNRVAACLDPVRSGRYVGSFSPCPTSKRSRIDLRPSTYSGCRSIGLGSHYCHLNAAYLSSHHNLIDWLRAVYARDWMGAGISKFTLRYRLLGRPRTFKNYRRTLKELTFCGTIGKNYLVAGAVYSAPRCPLNRLRIQVASSCVGSIVNWLDTGTVLDSDLVERPLAKRRNVVHLKPQPQTEFTADTRTLARVELSNNVSGGLRISCTCFKAASLKLSSCNSSQALCACRSFWRVELWFKVPARLPFDAGFNYNSDQSTFGVTFPSLRTVAMLCCLGVQAQLHPELDRHRRSSLRMPNLSPFESSFSTQSLDLHTAVGVPRDRNAARLTSDYSTHRAQLHPTLPRSSLDSALVYGHGGYFDRCQSEFNIISNLSFSTDVCLNLSPGVLLTVNCERSFVPIHLPPTSTFVRCVVGSLLEYPGANGSLPPRASLKLTSDSFTESTRRRPPSFNSKLDFHRAAIVRRVPNLLGPIRRANRESIPGFIHQITNGALSLPSGASTYRSASQSTREFRDRLWLSDAFFESRGPRN